MSKVIFRQAGVQTADWFTVKERSFELVLITDEIKQKIGYPCIIKPNDQGSTVGLTLVKTESEVKDGIKLALQSGNPEISCDPCGLRRTRSPPTETD